MTHSNNSFLCKSLYSGRSFSNSEAVRLVIIGISKSDLSRIVMKLLDFVNFNNGGTCVHWRIMDVILVF